MLIEFLRLTFSLIHCQMILVISSPSRSQTGWTTFNLEANPLLAIAVLVSIVFCDVAETFFRK